MGYYLVTYDLRKERDSSDYEKLYSKLRSFGDWAWPLESVWVVSASSANAVLKKLMPALDDNDGIIVSEMTNELCKRRLDKGTADWFAGKFACR